MVYRLANKGAKEAFPFIQQKYIMYEKFYKDTGLSDYAIELNTAEDFVSLDALCRATDDTYAGLFLAGNSIVLCRHGEDINNFL